MHSIFNATSTPSRSLEHPAPIRPTAKSSHAKPKDAAPQAHIRTVLIPSCGWPTEAMVATRKSSSRR